MDAKRFLTCATLFAGLLLLNAPLYSTVQSPVVGYTSVTVKPGLNLLALPYNDLSSEDGLIDVQDILQGGITNLDNLQYWDGTELKNLTYRTGKGWCVGLKPAVDDLAVYFAPGQGFWYKSKATKDAVLTFKGRVAVAEQGENTVVVPPGLSLVGPAVPRTYDVSELTFSEDINLSQLQYWDGTELQNLTYRTGKGWCVGLKPITEKVILPTDGFWFVLKNKTDPVTITFPFTSTTQL